MGGAELRRGYRLENLVAAVFQKQGYLVRTGVPLRSDTGSDATDIDVLGISFSTTLQAHRIACDCKEKARPRPYERILWARGLAEFLDLSEVYVALPKASLEVISFARAGHVRILAGDLLIDQVGRGNSPSQPPPFGMLSQDYSVLAQEKLVPALKRDRRLAEIVWETRQLFLPGDPYVNLNIAVSLIRESAMHLRSASRDPQGRVNAWSLLVADLAVAFCLALLNAASETIGIPRRQREVHILERLTYGDVSPAKAKEIFRIAQEFAVLSARQYVSASIQQAQLPFELSQIESPEYAPAIIGLIERAISAPELYNEIPQIVEYIMFDALSRGEFDSSGYSERFSYRYQERLKVTRNILVFLRDHCDVDLATFWPKHDNNLPRVPAVELESGPKAEPSQDVRISPEEEGKSRIV